MKTTRRLMRGIDMILAAVESASRIRAAISIAKAASCLDRVIDRAPKGQRRTLMRVRRQVGHAAGYIVGGFIVDQDGNLV